MLKRLRFAPHKTSEQAAALLTPQALDSRLWLDEKVSEPPHEVVPDLGEALTLLRARFAQSRRINAPRVVDVSRFSP
jgi:hypothetical protein